MEIKKYTEKPKILEIVKASDLTEEEMEMFLNSKFRKELFKKERQIYINHSYPSSYSELTNENYFGEESGSLYFVKNSITGNISMLPKHSIDKYFDEIE